MNIQDLPKAYDFQSPWKTDSDGNEYYDAVEGQRNQQRLRESIINLGGVEKWLKDTKINRK